eukprot:jgi/Undpi1/5023/HiC_scaffold_19.g08375.m1
MDAAGTEKAWSAARSVTPRRRGAESLVITDDTLTNIQNVVVLEKEGVVYCPIPKVASAEWKRALRWMVGIEDWEGEHTNLHPIVKNGLERLADRGIKETRLVLESDRFFRFLSVRDPAERLVSAFLNKCVTDGYESGRLNSNGAPSCSYLTLMPDLFPNTSKASLKSHERLRELVEGEPEDTFFHFVRGVQRTAEELGDSCMIKNHHFRPQACFCDMNNLLSAFYVVPFFNMSAEAGALASKFPEALPSSRQQEVIWGGKTGIERTHGADIVGSYEATGIEWTMESRTGVDETRREEIRVFLSDRFNKPQDHNVKVTRAADRKDAFLSERVMEIVYNAVGVRCTHGTY